MLEGISEENFSPESFIEQDVDLIRRILSRYCHRRDSIGLRGGGVIGVNQLADAMIDYAEHVMLMTDIERACGVGAACDDSTHARRISCSTP